MFGVVVSTGVRKKVPGSGPGSIKGAFQCHG